MLWLILRCLPRVRTKPDFLIRAFYYPGEHMLRFHAGHKHGKLRRFAIWAMDQGVNEKTFRSWMCIICGWVYEEEFGSPEDGLPPGTRWEDVPYDWVCPDCGASKDDFEMIEI